MKSGGDMKIEKGIPLPKKGSQREGWSVMEIGDSVFIPGERSGTVQGRLKYQIFKGWKFSARNCEQNGIKGCRVWRIK